MDNFSNNQLYKHHTGYCVFDESDDDSGSTCTDYEQYKPPLYTYEEIQRNVVIKGPVLSESSEIGSDFSSHYSTAHELTPPASYKEKTYNYSTIHPEVKTILNQLRNSLTPSFCKICSKIEKGDFSHYSSNIHVHNVRKWIHNRLKLARVSLDSKLIFCEVCNLVLCGTDAASDHYKDYLHSFNLEAFCTLCDRKIVSAEYMPKHLVSTRHRKNLAAVNCTREIKFAKEINISFDDENVQPMDNKEEPNEEKLHLSEEDFVLLQSVDRELRKLLNMIYFSKKLCLEESLRFLRMFNDEIQILTASHKEGALKDGLKNRESEGKEHLDLNSMGAIKKIT